MRRRRQHKGFTLIELMVVVALAAILLTLVAPSFADFIRLQRLKSVNAQVVTDMQFARSEAAARNLRVAVRFGQDAASTCYVVFTGAASACNCASTPVCTSAGAEARTTRVDRSTGVQVAAPVVQSFELDPATGGIVNVVTDDESGNQLQVDIDTFSDTAHKLRTVISSAGRPSVCTPPGSTMPGAAC